jgi:hypothetical protein
VIAISPDLMKFITPLLSTAKIERVNDDEQLANAVKLEKGAKQCYDDLMIEKETVVGPKYRAYDDALGVYTPKLKALDDLYKNLKKVTAAYIIKKMEEADEVVRLEKEKRDAEEKRQADIADQKLRDEEALRREAKEKADAAALETDAAKKSALEQAANAATTAADMAVKEAVAATEASIKVSEAPVFKPEVPSFKGIGRVSYKYSATVTDEKKALKWLVEHDGYGDMKGQKLTDVIQSACNKIAKRKEKDFKMDGAEIEKTPDSKVNAYAHDDSRIAFKPGANQERVESSPGINIKRG